MDMVTDNREPQFLRERMSLRTSETCSEDYSEPAEFLAVHLIRLILTVMVAVAPLVDWDTEPIITAEYQVTLVTETPIGQL